MSILTLELPDSEKSNFLKIISNLDYIKLIDDQSEDAETLELIEKGIKEAFDIEKGEAKAYSIDELYSELKNS
jgi:hypothetical protein